jgi:DNA-binding MarR family transcriptional regulator
MPTDLRSEIKQTKPFRSLEEEAMLSIQRTSALLEHRLGEVFKAHGITGTQYNVLRILRGAGPNGLCRNEVRDRLVAQVPDVTRLLDRMEEASLVERERSEVDRRLVATRITKQGLRLLEQLDAPVSDAHRHQLGHLSSAQLKSVIDLLAMARSGA